MPIAIKSKSSTPKLGDQVDDLINLREEIRQLEKELNYLKEVRANKEHEILLSLDDAELQKLSSKLGTASIKEEEVGFVEDWPKFYGWMRKNNAMYLLQRRINNKPYRELLAERRNRAIPGVSTITRRSIMLRKA